MRREVHHASTLEYLTVCPTTTRLFACARNAMCSPAALSLVTPSLRGTVPVDQTHHVAGPCQKKTFHAKAPLSRGGEARVPVFLATLDT
jgi:hypothetical protein